MTTTTPTSLTGTYRLDPAQSRLGFVARHAVGPKVRGAFESFGGRAHLDFAEPERSSAEVTVDVDSLTTGNTRRDEHLRTSFFDAADHPRITFRSTAIHRLGGDRFRLSGELTIKDRTRPVGIDVTRTGAADDPDGNSRVRFQGRATLSRKDWGVTWNVALGAGGAFVANKVTLDLDVAAVKTDASE